MYKLFLFLAIKFYSAYVIELIITINLHTPERIHVGLTVSLFCKLAMVPTALLKFLLRLGDSDDVTTVAVAVVLALLAALPLFPVVAVWAKLYQHCKKMG